MDKKILNDSIIIYKSRLIVHSLGNRAQIKI